MTLNRVHLNEAWSEPAVAADGLAATLYRSAADAFSLPRLVRLEPNLCAAAFAIMKMLPAIHMLRVAIAAGDITPDTTIVESTSGTFGMGLALACNHLGLRLELVSDPAVDDLWRKRLESLGARVHIVRQPAAVGGFQAARLEKLAEVQNNSTSSYWTKQYENPANPESYGAVAHMLLSAMGHVDILVGAVGSGGSVCGTSRMLRRSNPHLKVVGVDTHGSVLFGLPDAPRALRGLGNSILPPNVDHTSFDEVHWVSAAEAFAATRALFRNRGLFMGGTSGAAHLVAQWIAARHPDSSVAVILPDEGHRYASTIHNERWLIESGYNATTLPEAPRLVRSTVEVGPSWCYIDWARRPLGGPA